MYDEEKELICILDELGYTYSLETGCWCSKSHEDGTLFMTTKQAFNLAHRVAYRDDVRREEREIISNDEKEEKERLTEKKWLLCLGKNDHGQKVYLTKVKGPRELETTLNADCLTEWSGQEIQGLMEHFPNFAPAIEAMKDEVKGDAC